MINPEQSAASFGGLTQDFGLFCTKRDASNAQAPRTAADPAVRPSAEGCSNRDVVLSDASNAHAPHTASAMANDADGNFGYFNEELAAAVLRSCVANRDSNRGIGCALRVPEGTIVCGRIQVAESMTASSRRGDATRSAWRARPGARAHVLLPAAEPAGATILLGSTISTIFLDTFGPPSVTLEPSPWDQSFLDTINMEALFDATSADPGNLP